MESTSEIERLLKLRDFFEDFSGEIQFKAHLPLMTI
jgi:hypothetical protein